MVFTVNLEGLISVFVVVSALYRTESDEGVEFTQRNTLSLISTLDLSALLLEVLLRFGLSKLLHSELASLVVRLHLVHAEGVLKVHRESFNLVRELNIELLQLGFSKLVDPVLKVGS